ncbi:MAG: hypothetical protein VZQ47_10530 [Treponema sp.]|nr:hypothetical protein [Treponema sp.]
MIKRNAGFANLTAGYSGYGGEQGNSDLRKKIAQVFYPEKKVDFETYHSKRSSDSIFRYEYGRSGFSFEFYS